MCGSPLAYSSGMMERIGPERLLILLALAVVLGLPLLMAPPEASRPDGARVLTVITPHNEQIRQEFGRAFASWHASEYGEPAVVEWVRPGGTSEIRKQLQAIYAAAIGDGRITPEGGLADPDDPANRMPYDLLFGGGSWEHGQMKRGVSARPPGSDEAVTVPISKPAPFSAERLEEWYGPENRIGAGPLYDEEGYWLGNATSGFGIVYNRDVLDRLGLDEPTGWDAMTDPRLAGWVALADPRQSGSVATAYNSILDNYGWDEGWRILREMAANARYFSNDSKKVPIDVSQGEAAMGVAIDFYGRYQSQAVMQPGETPETSRVGYIDPPGVVLIDPDPISMLRGGPEPELAKRFIEFLLSDEGQALWQFPARGDEPTPSGAAGDVARGGETGGEGGGEGGGLGPREFELRRMPARRDFIERYRDRFIDKVDPFEIASDVESRGWRSAVGPMMGAFAIDIHADQTAAWAAINAARRAVAAGDADPALLDRMLRLFHEMPTHVTRDGEELLFSPENYRVIRNDWRDAGRWAEARIRYLAFFRGNYRAVERLWREARS